MKVYMGYAVVIVIEILWGSAHAIKWLALASSTVVHIDMDGCMNITGLVRRQRQVCRRNVEVMDAVKEGAAMAVEECKYQFKDRRWNCSMVVESTVFGSAAPSAMPAVTQGKLNTGTREAAFVHAISSAGVAHSVTRACSAGNLDSCGCDRTIRGRSQDGFEWAGCSDNVAYGNAFSKNFVDVRERAKGKRAGKALMNLHNNEAGRKILEQSMRVQCKCHGVSGSCELKTCWRAMPTFRQVGLGLREKFDGATEVEQKRIGTRRQLVPRNTQFKHHTDEDLVYLDPSPDFCEFDPKLGSMGTQGRLCSKNSKAVDGCELMCCGRGYVTRRRTVMERCQCKFNWCCYVKCQTCERELEEHFCR